MSNPKIKGLDKLNRQLESLKGIKTANSLLAGAYTLQKFSQINSPVDTGANRASAQSEIVDDHAEMSFNMDYSYYLEVGTENMEGRHYVEKAIDEHSHDVVKAVQKQLQKDIKESIK